MKNLPIVFLTIFIGITSIVKAQKIKPIEWEYDVFKKEANTYKIVIKASLQDNWHIYSQKQPEGAIAYNTKFALINEDDTELPLSLKEQGNKEKQEIDVLGITQHFYSKEVDFIKLINSSIGQTSIKLRIQYMICNNEQCMPPDNIILNIPLK